MGANKDVENKIVEKFKTARKHHTNINNRTVLTDPELSAYWSNKSISIDHCVDAPMHLLFEGVFKSILELSGEWLAEQNCRSKFLCSINDFIKKVSALNLSYCKVIDISNDKRLDGYWVAENYLGFSRIFLVAFSCVREIVPKDTKGLKEHENMIMSLNSMIHNLMCVTNHEYVLMEESIKLFLCSCKRFCDTFSSGKDFISNKGNMLSLLNLPDQIKKLGSLQMYWEGKYEKFIQRIKPELTSLRGTETYLKTKMERLQQKLCINHLDTSKPSNPRGSNSFKSYVNFDSLEMQFKNYFPVSGFLLNNWNNFNDDEEIAIHFCCKKSHSHFCLANVSIKGDCYKTYFGLTFLSFKDGKLNELESFRHKKENIEKSIISNVMLLPIVTINEINSDYWKENKLYAIINDAWQVYDRNKKFVIPMIDVEKFFDAN